MPSLFNRRSRSVSTSRPPPAASSSAHVAAAQAFLANRQPPSNLSASAAAAALRSMSPASTPVDQVQTKRMLNRQASNASTASAARGRARSNVQRQPSTGSMSDRTFRSPSPGRSASTQPTQTGNAPPVPPLPSLVATEDVPPIPQRSHRRSMSLENFTTRFASPPPSTRTKAPAPAPVQNSVASSAAALAARKSAGIAQAPKLERSDSQDSRNSYNFSYPRGSRPTSPPPRSSLATNGSTNGNSITSAANGISAMEAAQIQRNLSKTADKPVKKKKTRIDHAPAEGAHLQTGSMNTKPAPAATTTVASPARTLTEPAARSPNTKGKAALTGESSHFPDNAATGDSDVDRQAVEKRAQRAAGVLTKQPSVVREDWEGEQEEVQGPRDEPSSPTTTKAAGIVSPQPARSIQSRKPISAANVSRKMEDSPKTSFHTNVTTSETSPATNHLAPNGDDVQNARQTSTSPSRSFRFSDRLASDLTAGRKHNPLPRAISPAKSALKHHSPSRSDVSLSEVTNNHRRGSSVTPSESSEMSVDVAARKKANRVSFETTPEVVALTTDQDSATHSQRDSTRKGWLGFGKAKSSPLGNVQTEGDSEEGMKPRPALPSFGSVRKPRASDSSPSPASRNTRAATGSDGSAAEVVSFADALPAEPSVSSDQAIGRVLFEDHHNKEGTPLPPEVTTVEGSGYASDTESLSSDDTNALPAARTTGTSQASGVTSGDTIVRKDTEVTSNHNLAVPAIAIQPATPGIGSSETTDEWIGSVPGGFPSSQNASNISISDDPAQGGSLDKQSEPVAGLGLAGPEDEVVPPSPASSAHVSPLNTIAEEASDDNDSVYSDAAEDLSDLEGDGFGSINAIVDSPMAASSPATRYDVTPQSPTISDSATEPLSWDKSQAYWSGVSQQLKNNVTAAQRPKGLADSKYAVDPTDTTTPLSVAHPSPPADTKATSTSQRDAQPSPYNRKPVSTRLTKTNQQNTARAANVPRNLNASRFSDTSTAPDTKTSRITGQSGFRHSMRDASELSPTLRPRPQSMMNPSTPPISSNGRNSLKPPIKPASRSKLQRTLSNDSDSDSSFRRARAKKPAGSGFARRTMRGAPSGNEQPLPASKQNSRPASTASAQPASPVAPQRMRMSMRGSSDLNVPTLRTQQETKRSSSLFSRARKAKSPTRAPMPSPFGAKTKSRFADSDDEGESRPAIYRSRFANSSDEEDEPLRPVRGIPRRKDDADSTDLDDSSDDQRRKSKLTTPKKAKGGPLSINIASPAASEAVSPTTAKKKGLWERLRGGKKDKEPNAPFTIAERNKTTPMGDGDIAHPTAEPDDAAQLGFDSVAERDAMVALTMKKLESAQGLSSSPSSPPGKLQRRVTPQRVLSDSWPLGLKVNGISDDRPATSAGPAEPPTSTRPVLGERQPTTDTVRTAGGTPIYGRNGRKKKFPRLRKAFGLMD